MACNLYKVPSVLTPTTIIYIDCDGVVQSVSVPGGDDYYFCSTSLIDGPGVEEIGICNCSCQSINVSTIGLDITYVDCNDNIVSESIPSSIENPLYVFCSKYLITSSSINPVNPVSDKDCLSGTCNSDTSCYTFTPTGETGNIKYYAVNGDLIDINVNLPINFCGRGIFSTSNGVLVNEGPCIDGECPTTPTTRDLLIQKLNSLRGPCPEVCDGSKKIGGITGTDEINIITQNPL